ncbi:purine and uridine phosphorylase, partial [Amniculicola lignicola CBS 123094]
DYTIGWICALPKEQTAAKGMLDRIHTALPKPATDKNAYTLGSMGDHNIVIACLPKGHIGTNAAGVVATQMLDTFPSIRIGLMVGIGGGIPPKVRLGDVVVSSPSGGFSGVVQWDFGKKLEGGKFERTGALDAPPRLLLTALSSLETNNELYGSKIPGYLQDLVQRHERLKPKYSRSKSLKDVLFRADYAHSTAAGIGNDVPSGSCQSCDKSKVVQRPPRETGDQPVVHYGLIASGNQVIKDAGHRDLLNSDLGGQVLCVEMEAAGLMNSFPCIAVRGICDYADSHKNKDWQEYAAAVAAAFAKELLGHIQCHDI